MESGFSVRRAELDFEVRSICFGERCALLREGDEKRVYTLDGRAQLSVLAEPLFDFDSRPWRVHDCNQERALLSIASPGRTRLCALSLRDGPIDWLLEVGRSESIEQARFFGSAVVAVTRAGFRQRILFGEASGFLRERGKHRDFSGVAVGAVCAWVDQGKLVRLAPGQQTPEIFGLPQGQVTAIAEDNSTVYVALDVNGTTTVYALESSELIEKTKGPFRIKRMAVFNGRLCVQVMGRTDAGGGTTIDSDFAPPRVCELDGELRTLSECVPPYRRIAGLTRTPDGFAWCETSEVSLWPGAEASAIVFHEQRKQPLPAQLKLTCESCGTIQWLKPLPTSTKPYKKKCMKCGTPMVFLHDGSKPA